MGGRKSGDGQGAPTLGRRREGLSSASGGGHKRSGFVVSVQGPRVPVMMGLGRGRVVPPSLTLQAGRRRGDGL